MAESGYWLEDLRAARESLREGKAESALVTYAIMANEGYAIAQANAAYMLRKRMGYRYALQTRLGHVGEKERSCFRIQLGCRPTHMRF